MEKEELKTLKDIRRYYHGDGYPTIAEHDLRNEAIKWVKELYLFPSPSDEVEMDAYEFMTGNKIKYSEEGKSAIINFIKHFFNLKDEDLKWKKKQ